MKKPNRPPTSAPAAPPTSPLLPLVGDGALLLTLALASFAGGVPTGAAYGGDVFLGALRVLICIAGIISLATRPLPPRSLPLIGIWATWAWITTSFLVYSRFLTNDVLLFAEIPAWLDWTCYALLFTLAAQAAANADADVRARFVRGAIPVAIVISATWCAIVALGQYGEAARAGDATARVSGAFFSPNFAAGLYALALPLACALFLTAKNRVTMAAFLAAGATIVSGLCVTGSRVGALATGFGLVVAAFLAVVAARKAISWKRVVVLAVALAIAGALFARPLLQRVGAKAGNATAAQTASGNEQSAAFRTWTWRGTLRMIAANPILGSAPGTFADRYPPFAYVAKTDLAHQSYLQLAAEAGVPALVFLSVALLSVLLMTPPHLLLLRAEVNARDVLWIAALFGASVAMLLRGCSDSEWSLLADGLPAFSVLGSLAGMLAQRTHAATAQSVRARQLAFAGAVVLPLLLAAVLLRSNAARDAAAQMAASSGGDAAAVTKTAAAAWPPDPDALAQSGDFAGAARVEPNGKRFYQLAKRLDAAGNSADANAAFQEALRAEPTNMQSWREYALFLERHGRNADAIAAWQKVVDLHEGLPGTVRAISETTELHPAYAYAALGDAARQSDPARARAMYEKSLAQIERYAQTPAAYRTMEEAAAQRSGIDLAERRRGLRNLYAEAARRLKELGGASPDLDVRAAKTLRALDAMQQPADSGAGSAQ